ncbi:MAG: low molecular weight protein arginine phosphatase [Anaeromicrobium sp.]|uniref:low molecular weight protein arginine phosphatase n=1 Tax=Anaeromicrobium sp. TaxID=1929132 RepID=UPI0025DA0742|nr:low molecular weight protein arginine phosphatase [Anaeromicrobium sp.]MCT4592755.1 low molecular weight protein arginine phosphatase [Anaeromicrobium sp.]
MNILFVCTGNTCRSPMAEGLMKKLIEKHNLNINIYSAGIFTMDGLSPSENSILAMEEIGINIRDYKSNTITKELINKSHIILTMTKNHKEKILQIIPEISNKLYTLKEYTKIKAYSDISDPYGQNLNVYKACRDEINRALEMIISELKKEMD